jgi:hypothetical protein
MNIITKGAIAAAAAIAISTSANAQITLFNNVVHSYGTVATSGSSVTGVGTWESYTTYPFGTGGNFLTYIDLSTNTFTVSGMVPYGTGIPTAPIFLTGNFVSTSNYTNGSTFNLDGVVSFTGGDWYNQLASDLGVAGSPAINGVFTSSGNVGAAGVNAYSLTAGVPEPAEWAAMGMLASGLGGLVIRARRRKLA